MELDRLVACIVNQAIWMGFEAQWWPKSPDQTQMHYEQLGPF